MATKFSVVSVDALRAMRNTHGGKYHEPNCFIMDTSIEGANVDDMILYLVCDNTHPSFPKFLESIEKNRMYLDNYIAGDIRSKFTIVRFDYPEIYRTIWNHFVNSKYSKMYKGNKEFNLDGPTIRHEFKTASRPLGVMKHTSEFFEEEILTLLSNPSDELINLVWSKEFDSELNIDAEIINSNHLKECVTLKHSPQQQLQGTL